VGVGAWIYNGSNPNHSYGRAATVPLQNVIFFHVNFCFFLLHSICIGKNYIYIGCAKASISEVSFPQFNFTFLQCPSP